MELHAPAYWLLVEVTVSDVYSFVVGVDIEPIMIKKSPYFFFLYLESMYLKYLPCQILNHDFDDKSDLLNDEFSIRLPAITQFKKWSSSNERVGSGEDETSSNQDIKTNVAI